MSDRFTLVPRKPLVACMTCPLCNDLFDEATTISTCLHTFCKRCILDKFANEEDDSCPVCKTYLGSTPEDKLRPDHSLQDIRAKLFPKKETGGSSTSTAQSESGSPPGGNTERTVLSLVVGSPLTSEGSTNEVLSRFVLNNKSVSFSSNSLNNGSHGHSANSGPSLWGNSKLQNSNLGAKAVQSVENDALVDFSAMKNDSMQIEHVVKDNKVSELSVPAPARRRGRPRKNSVVVETGDSSESPQLEIDFMRRNRKDMPVWFCLVASEEKDHLPQLPSRFLRFKNGEIPVSYIQKYIASKFGYIKEYDVEIKFMGVVLEPNFMLSEVMDAWSQSGAAAKFIEPRAGESSKESLMTLTYSRKVSGQRQVQAPVEEPPKNNPALEENYPTLPF